MYILSFDASFHKLSIAIRKDEVLLSTAYEYNDFTQAEKLFPLVEQALFNASLNYSDINYLATTVGPGSFTGIRVGIAAARGILMAAPHILGIGLTNFEVIHFQATRQIKTFDYNIVLINAYREQMYVEVFNNQNQSVLPPSLIELKDLGLLIKNFDGIKVCSGEVSCLSNEDIISLPRLGKPDSRYMCILAYQQIMQNKIYSNMDPLYIKPPCARIREKTDHANHTAKI